MLPVDTTPPEVPTSAFLRRGRGRGVGDGIVESFADMKNVIVELYELPQEVKDLGGEVFTDRVFDLYKESPKLTADPIGLRRFEAMAVVQKIQFLYTKLDDKEGYPHLRARYERTGQKMTPMTPMARTARARTRSGSRPAASRR